MCGKQTFGVFNPAKELIQRLKTAEEEHLNEPDSDEEFQMHVINPPQATEEEAVTEIEHIHYEDDGIEADTDSDDSTWWTHNFLYIFFVFFLIIKVSWNWQFWFSILKMYWKEGENVWTGGLLVS